MSTRSRRVLTVCLLLLALWRGAALGQERLASIKQLNCTFETYATGSWNKGEIEAKILPAKLSIGFESINTDEGSAQVRGDFGKSDIVVRLSQGSLHFLQMFSAGPLYVTTVFSKETRPGKLQAVHTRHEFTEVSLPGFTSRPEQYYGECEAR